MYVGINEQPLRIKGKDKKYNRQIQEHLTLQ